MNKSAVLLVALFLSLGALAQDVKIEDTNLNSYGMRIISSKMQLDNNTFTMKRKNADGYVRMHPIVMLTIDTQKANKPSYTWTLMFQMLSDYKIVYAKGARLLIKLSNGETITLTADEGDYSIYDSTLGNHVSVQFSVRQATLSKLSNNVIKKVRFELVSDILECDFEHSSFVPKSSSFNSFLKEAMDKIIAQKNSTKDALYDGF